MPLRMMIGGLLCSLVVGALCCATPRSARCREVCEREARCSQSRDRREERFDLNECVIACTTLERTHEGGVFVSRHVECVAAAGDDCARVLACGRSSSRR